MSRMLVQKTRATISVRPYEGGDEVWDAFVERTPGATFCHLGAWRRVLAEALGARCQYLVCVDDDGDWQGVLPLVHVSSRLFGNYLVSVPFLNSGGPIGSPAACASLVDAAVAVANRGAVDLLELRSRRMAPYGLRRTDRKITVVLRLPASEEELWRQTFDAKLRSQIRRPLKDGMEVRFGPGEVRPFYEVFARNMRDLGTPVLPLMFFEEIGRHFPRAATFGVVYRSEKPVAAGCGFMWQGEFEMTWASSLREHNRQAPNMLLYWSFIQRMIRAGVQTFDFGRCTPGGGTHRFKRQWGGEDMPLPWAQWSRGGVSAPPSPGRPAYRMAAAVWRRLPVPVANWVGPHLARKLP